MFVPGITDKNKYEDSYVYNQENFMKKEPTQQKGLFDEVEGLGDGFGTL